MKKILLLSLAFTMSLGLLSVKAQKDVGVITLKSISSDCQHSATETVTIEVKNFGDTIFADTIPVSYQINSMAVVNDTIFVTTNFPANDTLVFSFATVTDLSTVDTFNFVIKTNYGIDTININDSLASTVYTYGNPAITLTSDLNICLGDTAELVVSGNHTYLWSTTDTISTINVVPATTTEYTVILTDTITTCQSTDTVEVTVINIVPSVTSNATICEGTSIQLSASGGVSYLWSNGDTTAMSTVTPTDSTWYYVTISEASCVANDSVLIKVHTNNVTFPSDTTVCAGDSVTITANGGTYLWSTTETTASITVTPTDTTTYTIAISDTNSCTYTDSVIVAYITLPNVVASVNDTTVCANYPVVVTVTGANTYTWNNGAAYSGNGATATLQPETNTIYIITGIISGCSSTDTVNTTTITSPDIHLEEEYNINPENELYLGVTAGYSSYEWSTGATTNSIIIDGSTLGSGSYNYWVKATANNNCMTTDSTVIIVGNQISVNSNELTEINIFPNPANEFVSITNSISNFNYEIINTNGTVIVKQNVEGNKAVLNISNISNGVYFIKINTKNNIIIKKLIIE